MFRVDEVKSNEIGRVMEIIDDAKRLLGKDSLQWQQGYPNIEVMQKDINSGNLFGVYEDGLLVGIESLIIGEDMNYFEIYDGAWLKDVSDTDLVIHRIAVKEEYHHRKIGQALMEYAEQYAKKEGCTSIKVDTHVKNIAMQKLLENNKYTYCGVIYLKRNEIDNQRIAFEKVIEMGD
ncbi:MAG: GNAT family N-acetyltransferase [Bacilli bacterium]|nr:GNAT family N-acetyltransferase [Bacilli bacterium]